MADLRAVILNAALAAKRVHKQFGIQERWKRLGGRIDVFGTIDACSVPLLFRPLDELLGAFLKSPSPGIVINTRRPQSVQRYTAAHELGHHLLGHEPSLDDEGMLKRSPFVDRPRYDEREVAADAFAVAFLIPDWLVAGEMRRHSWTPLAMKEPAKVYQMALRVGLSFEATCYVLRRYGTITAATCAALVKVPLKSVKQFLVPGHVPTSWHLDVWSLTANDDGGVIEAAPGDLIDIHLTEHSGGGYLWDIKGLQQSDLEVVADRRTPLDAPDAVGGHVMRHITTRAKAVGFGSVLFVERRPWERDALASYQFTYDLARPASPGLLPAQQGRRLGVNA